MKSSIILASALNGCIGINNSLPWNLPEDLKRFKKITSAGDNNIVIMGKNTFLSLKKPLPNRINYVISKTLKPKKGTGINLFNNT